MSATNDNESQIFLEAAISGKEKAKKSKMNRAKQAKVRDYEAHVLVCKGSDCKKRGSKDVTKAMKSELRSVGMNRDTRLDSVECLGLCKHGPNAIVYPGGTWYLGLDEDDARKVARSHIKNGEPVEHLAAEFRPKKKAN